MKAAGFVAMLVGDRARHALMQGPSAADQVAWACGGRQSGSRSIGAAPRSPELASGRIDGWLCPSATGCCAASSS